MRVANVLRITGAVIATVLFAGTTHAQLFRAYLSPTGLDTNPCTLPAPCRLLPAALTAVAAGGEIWMLDSSNYNTQPVDITKSVTIMAVPGAVGSIVALAAPATLGGPAVKISTAGLVVALRNIVIVPFPGGNAVNGIEMTAASSLTIENSLIANLPGNAVLASGSGKLEITNTIIRNNGFYAVSVSDGMTGDISGTKMLNNGLGGVFAVNSNATLTNVSVTDSVISGGSTGVRSNSLAAASFARIFVTRCTIQNTQFALGSETNNLGSSEVAVGASMIANNIMGVFQNGTGSAVRSSGNNQFYENPNQVGILTSVGLQ